MHHMYVEFGAGVIGSDYIKSTVEWETVLDLDALAKKENENWVWKGFSLLEPDKDRVLLRLSRGGADAVVIREFDLNTLEFVKNDNSFNLDVEWKTHIEYKTRDTVYVSTTAAVFNHDIEWTAAGYPRVVREW